MVYNLLSVLLVLIIILAIITIGIQGNIFLHMIWRKNKFIKKLERDTEDLSVDKFIDELEDMTNE